LGLELELAYLQLAGNDTVPISMCRGENMHSLPVPCNIDVVQSRRLFRSVSVVNDVNALLLEDIHRVFANSSVRRTRCLEKDRCISGPFPFVF